MLEHGLDEAEDIFGDDLVAFRGGVGAVGLHHSGDAEDSLEEKGEKGELVFFGNDGIGVVELMDVVGAIVGRQGNAGEGDGGSAPFEFGDDAVEVGAGVGDGEAAEAVVATKLDDHEGGFEGDDAVDAGDAVLGGVAADAGVNDAVFVSGVVEVLLEKVGVALAGVGTEAGGEAVAEADEQGAAVFGDGGGRGVGGGGAEGFALTKADGGGGFWTGGAGCGVLVEAALLRCRGRSGLFAGTTSAEAQRECRR